MLQSQRKALKASILVEHQCGSRRVFAFPRVLARVGNGVRASCSRTDQAAKHRLRQDSPAASVQAQPTIATRSILDTVNCLLGRPAVTLPWLARLCEPVLQEFAQLGCRLQLRDGLQFLESRRKGVGKTPDRRGRNSSYFGSK
jgi:hypothetical protein